MRGLGGAIPVAASALLETMEAETTTLRKSNDTMKRFLLCYAAQLTDPKLLSLAIRYYRLVARWLVASVDPPSTGLPLPAKVPRLFSSLPESCMDDVAQVTCPPSPTYFPPPHSVSCPGPPSFSSHSCPRLARSSPRPIPAP